MKPRRIKALQRQAQRMRVWRVGPGLLVVESRTNRNAHHIVTVERQADGSLRARCTCPWARHGGFGCSHVMAALVYLAKQQARAVSFWPTKAEAQRQRNRVLRLAGDNGANTNGLWLTTRPLRKAS